jgi:cytochrome b561
MKLTNAPVMVCTEFLAFAHLNIYMIYLAVPIKGLMRIMAGRRHSLIYFLNWGSGGCGVYSQDFGCN